MNIEFSLVYSESFPARVFSLMMRSRIVANNDEEILDGVCKFVTENIEQFDQVLIDKDMVNRLKNLQLTTISELYSLKYLLAQSGLDILIHQVAELEINADGIEEGGEEVIVVNNLDATSAIARPAAKIHHNEADDSKSALYSKIVDMYGFFSTDLTAGFKNPFTSLLDQLKRINDSIGVSPESFIIPIESTLEYLGKSIIVIQGR